METLFIDSSDCTPRIVFNTYGNMLIEGRSLPEDVKKFYSVLIDWVVNLETDEVNFNIKFEYLNTSSSKEVWELLKCLDANYKISKININWYYEFDDYDILELGQIYEESMNRTTFKYLECVEQP